ncbi:MAG TPA: penicillin-binding protein 2 [bacterium]|nr:penicillin-binding protein 2 [bacterium]
MLYGDYSNSEDRKIGKPPFIYIFVVFGLMVILAVRLFQIQVFNYNLYYNKSEDYRIKRIIIEAPRGFIYDRNGEILATNRMNYSVTIDPFEIDKFDDTIPRLSSLVPYFSNMYGVHEADLVDSIKVLTRKTRNPSIIIQDADFRTLSIIEEHSLELPGVGCIIGQRRDYPHGSLVCHVIGYMGKLTKEETDILLERGYYKNQWIGRYGIEQRYENILKGKNGAKFLEKNYLNRFLGTISDYTPDPAIPGKDATLTIDYRLQMAAKEAFGDSVRGAIVALNPQNGEVLILVSSPSFDPNEFASIITEEHYALLVNDPEKPLYNRAIQGTYSPGSTFKMVTALAGLENGITPNTKFQPCRGFYYFGREYECWNRDAGGHGSLDMINAITQSCNVYYYQLGIKLGIEKWYPTCEKLGFGRRTGIDLSGEETGNLPSPAFYKERNITYTPGMTLNLSIGQGENDVTPLQLANYTGIIAMEGLNAKPHLIMKDFETPKMIEGISQESFKVVKKGMFGVVNNLRGTAKSVRIPGHIIAGKTGTVQNPHGSDHKIFIAFAPYDDPAIAIACVAENVGEIKPSLAVMMVKHVLVEYFKYYPDDTTSD